MSDALFHYTTARGLLGILTTGQLWGTAHYCANDESELATGLGALSPLFRRYTHELIDKKDSRVATFFGRGVDPRTYGEDFEKRVVALALSRLDVFITCFCRPSTAEDFIHGLLSQWRGYGFDGGYAIQFSRKKLLAEIERCRLATGLNYDLMDVHYTLENSLRAEMLQHSDSFIRAYSDFLDDLAKPLTFPGTTWRNPIASLPGGPLESLLNYLTHTKSIHFREELECRLSLVQASAPGIAGQLPVHYYDRSGIPVPYTQTPKDSFNVLDCIEWIIVGPAPRIDVRFKAVQQLARQSGAQILVRASHIPFTRV